MDQKNTIVKCKAHPNCLFNYNGVCDNYVINIGVDGKCEGYVETAKVDNFEISEIEEIAIYKPGSKEPLLTFKEPQKGQRAKCNIYDNACDLSFLKEDLKKIQQTLEQNSIPCIMKVAEFNKPNKNQSVINDWDYAATSDICKTCKKVVYGQPCKWKDVAYGVWTCYEEEKNEV